MWRRSGVQSDGLFVPFHIGNQYRLRKRNFYDYNAHALDTKFDAVIARSHAISNRSDDPLRYPDALGGLEQFWPGWTGLHRLQSIALRWHCMVTKIRHHESIPEQ